MLSGYNTAIDYEVQQQCVWHVQTSSIMHMQQVLLEIGPTTPSAIANLCVQQTSQVVWIGRFTLNLRQQSEQRDRRRQRNDQVRSRMALMTDGFKKCERETSNPMVP